MKKNVSAAAVMVALAGTMMFTSCSNNDMYDANVVNQNTVKSYEQQFVEAFGPVSETQSWDFTASAKASTRGDEQPTVTWSQKQNENGFFQSFANKDFEDVKSLVVSTEAQDWKPYAKMNLHPVFSKGNGGMYNYYVIGVDYNDLDNYEHAWISINVKYNSWYSGGSAAKNPNNTTTNNLNFNTYRVIDTQAMADDKSFFWYAVALYPNTTQGKEANDDAWDNLKAKHELKTCKMFTVNGRQYVAFDCNGDEDYSDLICLLENYEVKEAEIVNTEAKRYMMEDLGSVGDFDFNDCVVDLTKTTWSDGKVETKGVVRALGGILDITILIDGKQVWSKNGQEGLDVKTMYNTTSIDKNAVYGEFDASDWQPSANNISFAVKGENAQVVEIKFPETGSIPQMVAVNAGHDWMTERSRVPSIDWFK